MNRKISVLLTLATLIVVCLSNFSFAYGEEITLSQKITNVFDGVEGYSFVDSNDKDVTVELLDKFGVKYEHDVVIKYLSKNDYSIKQDNAIIEIDQETRSLIENRRYGSTYTKTLSKYHNGSLLQLEITFQILGELDFDTTSNVITKIYSPSLYILNIDKPSSITSAQVSEGTLSNYNRTVKHTIVLTSEMKVPVYGDIYEWVEMPKIIQNYSYTPSAY